MQRMLHFCKHQLELYLFIQNILFLYRQTQVHQSSVFSILYLQWPNLYVYMKINMVLKIQLNIQKYIWQVIITKELINLQKIASFQNSHIQVLITLLQMMSLSPSKMPLGSREPFRGFSLVNVAKPACLWHTMFMSSCFPCCNRSLRLPLFSAYFFLMPCLALSQSLSHLCCRVPYESVP